MKRNSIRRCSIVAVLISLFMSLTLMACSSQEAVNEETTAEEEKDVVIVDDTVQQEEASVETEKVEVSEETSNEEEKEVEVQEETICNTPQEWMDFLGLSEPTIFIWNDVTRENTILEKNAEYELKENDRLFLYAPIRFENFKFSPLRILDRIETGPTTEIFLTSVEKEEIVITEEVEGQTYEHQFTLVGTIRDEIETEETKMTVEDIVVDSEQSVDEWIESIGIGIEEPFIAMVNDATATKKY